MWGQSGHVLVGADERPASRHGNTRSRFYIGGLEIANGRHDFTAEHHFVKPSQCPPILGYQIRIRVARTCKHGRLERITRSQETTCCFPK